MAALCGVDAEAVLLHAAHTHNVNPATQWDEEMQSFYPEKDIELRWTQRLMAIEKVVLSTTRNDLRGNTSALNGNVAEAIASMKAAPGGDILLMCGPGLAHLTAKRLIDEYKLFMLSERDGSWCHLFRDISEPVNFTFQRSRLFRGGVNLVYYTPQH